MSDDGVAAVNALLEAEPKFHYGMRIDFKDGASFFDVVDSVGDVTEEEFLDDLREFAGGILESGVVIRVADEMIVSPADAIASVVFRSTPYEENGLR